MSAIFISHRSTDDRVAAQIHDWLESKGHRSVFLDFDPADGIPAGRDWEQELYQRIRSCRAVIVVCSRASMSSKWVFAEITHARALGKQILPVRIDDCTIDSVISDRQVVDMTEEREEAFDRLWRGLLAAGIDPDDLFDWDGSRPPYPGLVSMQEADAAVFFGRNEETTEGLDLVNQVRRQGSGSFVMVLGASGSGKSSLVRAGLVPRLRRDRERWLVLDPVRPQDEPVRQLAASLGRAFAAAGEARDWTGIRDQLQAALDGPDESVGDPLVEMAGDLLALSNRPDARVLLVVDQFEELLGYGPGHPATRFQGMLRGAAGRPGSPMVVVGTMRSDFLGAFQNAAPMLGLRHESLLVGPLSRDTVTQIIEQPAQVAGLELEPGLAALMVADTTTDDALPLLAFTLRELYDKGGADGRLDIAEYRDDLGGINGAVARVADEVIDSENLDEAETNELRRSLLAMVRLTDDERWSRRVARWEEFPNTIDPVLERLVDARLLVSSSEGDVRTLEVTHEALFRSWGLLAGWIDENVDALRLRRDVQQASRSWDRAGRNVEDVWRGARLARAEELLDDGDLPVEAVDRDFVRASLRAQQAEAEKEEKRRRRRLQISAGVAIGASILAVVAIIFFIQAQNQATRADRTAAIALGRQAQALSQTDPALAVAVAGEARAQFPGPETDRAVMETKASLARSGLVGNMTRHVGHVTGVAFNGDGSRLATSSIDGTARVWDAETGEELLVLSGHDDAIREVVYSHDASRIVTVSNDGTAKVWDADTGSELLTLAGHQALVRAASFNHDGTRLVTGSNDNTAKVWDAATGTELFALEGHEGSVTGATYSPDGTQIVTTSVDETIKAWDAETGNELQSLTGHSGAVWDVAFNPDGRSIVTGGEDRTARLWDLGSGAEVSRMSGHADTIEAVAFSRDGLRIATASVDRTARVWDVGSGEVVFAITGHAGSIVDVAFNPDGTRVATGSRDMTARIWGTGPESLTMEGHTGPVRQVHFNPDGSLLASSSGDESHPSDDYTARIWDATTGAESLTLNAHTGPVRGVAFNHDGQRVATTSDDTTAMVWDSTTGEQVLSLVGHSGWVFGVAFNHDGSRIVTAGRDEVARVWDAATAEELRGLVGHSGPVYAVAFSTDGTRIVTGGKDETARVWDAGTGNQLRQLDGHTGSVFGVAFNHDGTQIVTASQDNTARIWETSTGDQLVILSGHTNEVTDAAFNHDGTRVATSARDKLAKVWDVASGVELVSLIGHEAGVEGVAFSDDGTRIATASFDFTARVWDVETEGSCTLVEQLVSTEQLTDALGGVDPIACTNLRP